MIEDMELRRWTWIAAIKLAIVFSVAAAVLAVVASSMGDLPAAAIVLPVVVVAFTTSWVQTGRIHRETELPVPVTHETIVAASAA